MVREIPALSPGISKRSLSSFQRRTLAIPLDFPHRVSFRVWLVICSSSLSSIIVVLFCLQRDAYVSTLLGWKLDPERTNLAQSCLFYDRHIYPLKLIYKDEFWSIFYSAPVDEICGKAACYEHLSVFRAANLLDNLLLKGCFHV